MVVMPNVIRISSNSGHYPYMRNSQMIQTSLWKIGWYIVYWRKADHLAILDCQIVLESQPEKTKIIQTQKERICNVA